MRAVTDSIKHTPEGGTHPKATFTEAFQPVGTRIEPIPRRLTSAEAIVIGVDRARTPLDRLCSPLGDYTGG